MININENFLNLQDSYLFSTVAKKVSEFQKNNPDKKVIKLGIGDVTKPIVPAVIEAMHKATDELANEKTFSHNHGTHGFSRRFRPGVIRGYSERIRE